MAAGHSDYTRGEMPVDAQESAFKGFMAISIYGGAFIAVILLMPTLFYGANMGWLPALITSWVFAVVLGIGIKLKGAWFASMTGLAIITAIFCAFFSAIT